MYNIRLQREYREPRIEQPVTVEPAPVFGLSPDFQSALKNGSYGAVIFLLIIFMISRKQISDFTKAHMEQLNSATKANESNAETMERFTKSMEDLVRSVDRSTRNNQALVQMLSRYVKIEASDLEDK